MLDQGANGHIEFECAATAIPSASMRGATRRAAAEIVAGLAPLRTLVIPLCIESKLSLAR